MFDNSGWTPEILLYKKSWHTVEDCMEEIHDFEGLTLEWNTDIPCKFIGESDNKRCRLVNIVYTGNDFSGYVHDMLNEYGYTVFNPVPHFEHRGTFNATIHGIACIQCFETGILEPIIYYRPFQLNHRSLVELMNDTLESLTKGHINGVGTISTDIGMVHISTVEVDFTSYRELSEPENAMTKFNCLRLDEFLIRDIRPALRAIRT